jgi:hypothetical protein
VARSRRDGRPIRPTHRSAIATFPSIAWLLATIGTGPRPRIQTGPRFHEERLAAPDGAPALRHVPRIVCGRTVLSRERWIFAPGELPRSVAALDGLRGARGLPRHVFARSDREQRPIGLDLDAPLCGELLLGIAAEAAREVVVEEALPAPGDCWLVEARTGVPHACELLVTLEDEAAS